jgi:class 3 adenylate cyclase/tetratricopeptide (TPR) repeat protein
MKCLTCQHINDVAAKFCSECAAPLSRTCVRCGHQLPPSAKFCPECAEPTGFFASGPPSLPDRQEIVGQPPFGSPESYTPKHLARKILNSRSALEGERKQVTVLFADLKGSMELLAERDPEEARKLLDPVIEHMMEAVHHYEGTVNQVMGDGIMALFGAPLAHEDHAVRACYAALRMQERVKRHAEGIFHAHGANLQIRVGLNSGEVVVRAISSDLHMDYTAIGRTTHLAARMEQLASPGSVLLTPSTLGLVEGFVTVKPLGMVPIKGLADPLEVHEVTGVGPARTRFQAVARRGLTRFVGRDAELEQLRRAQQLAGDGRGQVVALVAEAGVGKSRLVYELTHSHSQERWLVLECGAVSYGKAMSYLPVVNLLKSYFEIQDRDSLQAIGDKVAAKLLALDDALEPTLPALLALLDVPMNPSAGSGRAAAWRALDPGQRRQRTLDAVRRLLLREARERPLMLIFEDLHWVDNETRALLDGLVESLGSARILLLATYRPEYQHDWDTKTYYSQMRLDALSTPSAGKLLDALLGDDPALAPLKHLLVKRGNPFFLEETVRTLVETKALEGAPGHYRLTRPVEAIQVPATVQVMLAARVDRLSLEDKRLLQVAAVVGRHVPFSLLRPVAELPDEALRGALDRLQAAEFVYETGLFPDLQYSFKHALTQDVAYGGLLQERRRELHARIVDAIETLHHNRLGEQIELLAHHALRGELREKAVSYLRQAGLRAGARSARQDSVAWFDSALSVLDSLPESPVVLEQAFDIRLELRHMLVQLGDLQGGLKRLREAAKLAQRSNSDHWKSQVAAYMTNMHLMFGELDEALESGTRALEIAERLGDLRLRILATSYLGSTHYHRGEYQRTIERTTGNLAAIPADAVQEHFGASMPVSIFDRCQLIRSLAELGQFADAAKYAAEAFQLAEPTQRSFAIGFVHQSEATIYLLQGHWRKALPSIERAMALFRAGNIGIQLPIVIAQAGWALAELGEAADALGRLRESEQIVEREVASENNAGLMNYFKYLGRAHLALGQLNQARRLANHVIGSWPNRHGHVVHFLRLLGDVASHPDRFDAETGEAHYRKALALAEPLSMRPLVAHCHLGLGKLYQRTGKREQAHEQLTTATTLYREMDMRFWLEQADAETSS